MAIDTTTVEVVMPAMGDSVSEGTVLEWHKAEGDSVAADETLVEISTDKVDAEVPAPVDGTVVKVHVAEGDTIHVGSVLAEIAPTNGGPPAGGPPAPAKVEEQAIEIVMPQMGESV
jgi:multifunctional 2-oxoglutarate metabolism enzyme